MPTTKTSKWQRNKKPICHKFGDAVEKTREQTADYWDQMALPKARETNRKPKPIIQKPKKEKKPTQLSAYKEVDIRDEGYCQFPGCYKGRDTNHHHIIFRSQSGGNHVANLVTLCVEHHTLGKQSPHQSAAWRRYWEGWAEERYPDYWREIREGKMIHEKERNKNKVSQM